MNSANSSNGPDGVSSLLAVAEELVGGDQVVARQLLRMVTGTNRTTLALLQDCVDTASWDNAASAAHRLAGSARMLACDGLVVLIGELEAAARAHDGELAGALLPRVTSAVNELEMSIQLVLDASA
jgi:HPt (histidine-containing phosphotransfer) domain-containing protein